MRDAQSNLLPEGCELTVDELREMATRQQQQIESQQQLLVAREQRLKFLQQQEGRSAAVGAETDNLRRLQERVESQEAKLRRLRALRGQDTSRMNTVSMTTDLDAIRHLFSEKEKELVIAVAKVEELTRQLEDIRNGGSALLPNRNKQHSELEKLRRELLYRNSVNREASTRISTQKDTMTVRCDEVSRIDKRIGELQQRLQRKRLLNQQLASQITAATQAKQAQLKAVQLKALRDGFIADSSADIGKGSEQIKSTEDINNEFGRAKQDPKYQTLPYNTKFSASFKSKPLPSGDYPTTDSSIAPGNSTTAVTPNAIQDQPSSQASTQLTEDVAPSPVTSSCVSATSTSSSATNGNNLVNGSSSSSNNNNLGVVTRTVHSIPTHHPSRGHAMAPSAVATAVSSASSSSVRSASTISVKAFSQTQTQQAQLQEQQTQTSTAGRAQPSGGPNGQPVESRPQLPPTSLSVNFAQKLNVGVTSQGRSTIHNHAAEVQNIRATVPQLPQSSMSASMSTATTTTTTSSGIPATSGDSELDESGEDVSGGSSHTKGKPALPPKPLVPAKPLPPPRQKGDPLASSTESLNAVSTPASQRGTSQQRSTQVYRYASQNMIMSTYTQQSGGGDGLKVTETQLPSSNQKLGDLQLSNNSQKTSEVQPSNDNQELDNVQTISNNLNTTKTNSNSINNNNWQMDRETDVSTAATTAVNTINSFNNNSSLAITSAAKGDGESSEKVHVSISRRIEMPPDFMFPEDETPPSDLLGHHLDELDLQPVKESEIRLVEENGNIRKSGSDVVDNAEVSQIISSELEDLKISVEKEDRDFSEKALQVIDNNIPSTNDTLQPPGAPKSVENDAENEEQQAETTAVSGSGGGGSISAIQRIKKGNLKTKNSTKIPRRVSFDPLALLLDASLEGELELVKRTAMEVPNPSAANDEGITALHNAICAGHYDIVTFLISFGCDVNAPDSDGWTPLHCAASCNNVAMVKFLVEHGACILATTLSDHETAAEKCEQDEEGYDGCSQYLYSIQEKLGIMNGGVVYAVYEYESQNADELALKCGDCLTILRRGDEYEREWWWAKLEENCGYIPRNLLGLYPRVKNPSKTS